MNIAEGSPVLSGVMSKILSNIHFFNFFLAILFISAGFLSEVCQIELWEFMCRNSFQTFIRIFSVNSRISSTEFLGLPAEIYQALFLWNNLQSCCISLLYFLCDLTRYFDVFHTWNVQEITTDIASGSFVQELL